MAPHSSNICATLVLASLVVVPLGAGCGEPSNPESIGPSLETETDGNLGDTGDYCLLFPDVPGDPPSGWTHRCEGDLSVHFSANVTSHGSQSFDFDFYFGDPFQPDDPDDSFANPKVMACCSPMDPPDPNNEEWANAPHYKACFHDMIEQGCRSLVFRLRQAADDLSVGGGQVEDLADWIAEHQQECREAFYLSVLQWEYSPEEPWLELEATWNLPDGTVLNGWPSLSNIDIALVSSPPNRVYNARLPPDPADWQECGSQYENNDNIFAVADDPIDDFVLESGSVDLLGPKIGDEFVVGSAPLASARTLCDLCSTLSHVPDGDDRIIDYLLLDAIDAEVGTSVETLTLDRTRIQLYEPLTAVKSGRDQWTIAAGKASFVVSGFAEGEAGLVMVPNSTAIDLKWSSSLGWRILPFELEYTDATAETWTITIGTLTWEE